MLTKLRYFLIPLAIIVVGGAIMAGLIATREKSPRRTPSETVKKVSTRAVETGPLVPQLVAYGRVTSAQPIQLISEVSGKLWEGDIPFKPAQSFRRGDILVRIDDRQIRLALNSKKAELLTALAQLLPELAVEYPEENKKWSAYFNSCEFDRPLDELPEPANQKIKLYLARFNIYKLYFDVKDLEITSEDYYFRAPFDGSVVSTELRVGSTARQGSRLGEIINLNDLEVEISMSAEEVAWLDYSRPVILNSHEIDGQWEGRITRVGSEIDARTQAVPIYVALDVGGTAGLINGSFLMARMPGQTINGAVEVPREALYSERYVYLLSEGKLQQRDVTVAFSQTDHVIVSDGLYNGDTLVTDVLQGVAPGMRAEPRILPQDQ